MRKILFVVPWYETEKQPQGGTFFRDMAEALVDAGNQVRILYPLVAATFKEFLTGSYAFPANKGGKVPVYYSFIPNVIPRPGKVRPWLLSARSLFDFNTLTKDWGRPDLIHAQSFYRTGFIARQISRWFGIPYIISEHYSIIGRGLHKNVWTEIDYSKICLQAEQIIAVSHALRNDLNKQYEIDPERVTVIPNMVHDLFFEQFTEQKLSGPFKLHFTAFLRPVKRLDLLIRAIHILEKQEIDVVLTVAGDGSIRCKMEALADSLGISDSIHFFGNLPRNRIKEFIDNSHAVISTSEYETFGVNLLEGLACGRPVITTDSGGPRDFVHDENGILVEDHKPESVADAVIGMIERYGNYNQVGIRRETKNKFAKEAIIPQLIEVYDQVIHE